MSAFRLFLGVALLASAALANAQIATIYYACVAKDGTLTMVSVGATCPKNTTLIQWNQTGPQGATGAAGPQGVQGPQGPVGAPGANPLKVATLRWFSVLDAPAINLGMSTAGLAFDGANVWVAAAVDGPNGYVFKVRASDGAVLGQFQTNSNVATVAYDGTYVWANNNVAGSVTRLLASDGSCVPFAGGGIGGIAGQCSISLGAGGQGTGIAFDGTNIWAANYNANYVRKIRARDGQVLGDFATGSNPFGMAFDGANVWIANIGSNNVTKLRASDGANLGTFQVGVQPLGVAFDGESVWISNLGSSTVTKLRGSDGACAGTIGPPTAACTFPVGQTPYYLAFDGSSLWVASYDSGTLTRLRASDGANLGSFPAGPSPLGIAFDGANIWVSHHIGNTLTKH